MRTPLPSSPVPRPGPVPAAPSPLGDRGQATVLMAITIVVAGLVTLGLVRSGAVAVDAARARTAADAAALAGAAEGRTSAERVARANGGRLVAYAVDGDEVDATVVVGTRRARARADVEGTWCADGRSPEPDGPYTAGSCPSSPG